MSFANLQTLIAPLVLPGQLIMARQNGPRPPKPFTTIDVRTINPLGTTQRQVDESGNITIIGLIELNVEIQRYGLNSFDAMNELSLKLIYPSNLERADALGLGVSRITQVNRVPEVLNTSQYEESGLLELIVYDSIIGVDYAGIIEGVELNCFEHKHLI